MGRAALKPSGGIKTFATRPLGRVLLIAVAILVLVGSLLVLGPFIAIPALLLFGLALPIYMGEKRPRRLALWGLVILLVGAPLTAVAEVAMIRAPSAPVDSSTVPPYGNGSAVLQHAVVSPFTASPGTTFTFSVRVVPTNLPSNSSQVVWLDLFVSTCPGATSTTSPYCGAGYPFIAMNKTFGNGTRTAQTVTFNVTLHATDLWWWQMAAATRTTSGGTITWVFLAPQNGYGGVEGPVTGDFLSTVGLVILSVYSLVGFYEGIPFYLALLVYFVFKSRERRRKEAQAAAASTPKESESKAPTPAAANAASAPKPELHCPKCNAVVYANEATCWKCGATLTAAETSSPLPSSPAR